MQSLISEFSSLVIENKIAVAAVIVALISPLLPSLFKLLGQLITLPFKKKQEAQTAGITVSTQGNNSPAVNASDNAHIIINNYHGANAEEVERLQNELDLSNAAIKPLLRLLSIKNISLEKRTERFAELASQYKALQDRLKQYEKSDEFALQAERYLEEGKLAEAEKSLEAANEHDKNLVEERKKDITKRTFDLASISELQLDYDKAIARYKTVTELDPTKLNAWLKLGRLSTQIGQSQQALEAFRQLKRNAKDLQRKDMQSLGLEGEGDILAKHGYSVEALKLYQEKHQILFQQSKQNPESTYWQRELTVSFDRIGDMHKANDNGEKAIQAYQDALEIRKTLAKRDPNNSDRQRDLSVSYDKIGDMHKVNGNGDNAISAYQDAFNIYKTLTEKDPDNTLWQQDLSRYYERIGDMYKANDDGEKAIQAYQNSLAIWKKLIVLDPNNTDWQRGITIPYDRIGDMYKANGNSDNAIRVYQDALVIHETLAKRDPNRADWQIDLAVSYSKFVLLYIENDKAKAQEYGEKGLTILETLYSQNRLPVESDWRGWFKDQLASLE